MTIEKLERVIWRLRTNKKPEDIKRTNYELRKAIMLEIGTDPRTYKTTREALIKIGWIQTYGKVHIRLTGKDLTDT